MTSDGGLILVRELDERLDLSELMDRHLSDSRRGKDIQLPLADLLRQSIYSWLAGYADVNDAARLSRIHLPAHWLAEGLGAWSSVDLPLTVIRQTELLTHVDNLACLAALSRELVARAEAIDSPRRIVLHKDSTEVPV